MTTTADVLREIAANGKTAEAIQFLERESASAARAYDEIRKDDTVSESHRNTLLARTAVGRREAVDAKLSEMAKLYMGRDRNDAGRVFGTDGLDGDKASLTISMRDAQDRVADIGDPDELSKLLAKATRSGDEVLARAIAQRATDIGDEKTMNSFLDDREYLRESGERAWARQHRANDTFALTAHVASVMPAEFPTAERARYGAMEQVA